MKHVGRDVQKNEQGYGEINEHNCMIGRTISTTMCIKCMYSLIFLCTKKLISECININLQGFCCCRKGKKGTNLAHRIGRQGRK